LEYTLTYTFSAGTTFQREPVYKLRIHRIIWFPYFVGRPFLGLVFLLLLIIAGSITGPLISALQFQVRLPATLPVSVLYLLAAVCACTNITYLLLKSRPDFLTWRLALVPVLLIFIVLSLVTFVVSTLTFVAASAHITWSNLREVLSDHYTTVLLTTGSQASLIVLLFSLLRFLSADAVDLDAIGTLIARLDNDTRALASGPAVDTAEFAKHRESLRETLDELRKRLSPTPDLAIMPDFPAIVAGIKSFQSFDQTADEVALRNELSTVKPQFVQTLVALIGRSQ
jgi:hypothetical protein